MPKFSVPVIKIEALFGGERQKILQIGNVRKHQVLLCNIMLERERQREGLGEPLLMACFRQGLSE